MLQEVARRVAACAIVMDDALHAHVVGSVSRQSGEDQVARQLADEPLGVLDLLERKIRPGPSLQLGLAIFCLEAERLRPYTILTGRKRGEIVGPGLVGE